MTLPALPFLLLPPLRGNGLGKIVTFISLAMACTRMVDGLTPFVLKYLDRIGLEPSQFEGTTPLGHETLCKLSEAHLRNIPFENLAQHGGSGGPVSLELEQIKSKILDRKRGGFCLELNPLYGALLEELGFDVVLVPAVVYKDGSFGGPATHIVLIVTCKEAGMDDTKYFADVGFGEPPCNPLKYEFQKEQVTSEGMISRIMESKGNVVLEWCKDGEWVPRLQWKLADSLGSTSPTKTYLQNMLDLIHDKDSMFACKLIVCKLTAERKITLAGNKLKISGPPRHTTDSSIARVERVTMKSLEQARETLTSLSEYGWKKQKGWTGTR